MVYFKFVYKSSGCLIPVGPPLFLAETLTASADMTASEVLGKESSFHKHLTASPTLILL